MPSDPPPGSGVPLSEGHMDDLGASRTAPAYAALHGGELARRAGGALRLLERPCSVCPRRCRVDRLRDERSICHVGRRAIVASVFAHHGEEDPLRGWNGSGTIFLAGCNLRCVFCQNFDVSWQVGGVEVSAEELAGLMLELQAIKSDTRPSEILLVADAMTGQDAVQVAQSFNDTLDLTGVILTKVEGDARGGAALSMRTVINKPIKFMGVGEKLDALEVFHPDRLASRILGMGDVLTLIEKAQEAFDTDQAQELERKLRKETFTLDDFRDQLRQVRKIGSLEQIMGMIPGMNKLKGLKDMQPNEKELVRIEAIINSMTPAERANHFLIDGSRRRRIANGSGTTVQDVNRLLKNFAMTQKMMKKMLQSGKKGKRRFMPFGLS